MSLVQQGTARSGSASQDTARRGRARSGPARQGKSRLGAARPGKSGFGWAWSIGEGVLFGSALTLTFWVAYWLGAR